MLPSDLRQAYSIARDAARAQPDALGDRAGHRLFWARGGASQLAGRTILPAHPAWDAVVIVGRHPQCGIVLGDDPAVEVRHLLLRSIALPSGGVAMRVLDLHTDNGFMLPDGSLQTSIFAEGPVTVAVGEHSLIALPASTPVEGKRDDRYPTDLPPAEMSMSVAVQDQLDALSQAMSPYRANARPRGGSRITLMPKLVMLGDPRVMRVLPDGGERWSLTLERDGRSAMQTVTEDDLVAGVLIGRSEKCLSEELRRITDNNTSRVHVLILREGEQICAYDLASSHGMYQDGGRARRVVLGARATLTLGHGRPPVRVYWERAR